MNLPRPGVLKGGLTRQDRMTDPRTFDSPERLPQLAADLGRLAAAPRGTEQIDPQMRQLISGHFANAGEADRAHRSRRRWRLAAAAGGLAAVVSVGALLVIPGVSRRPAESERSVALPDVPPVPAPADLDGDGVVDILDAYRLARRLESGEPLDGSHDLNGDGRVDRNDVRYLALEAVRLPEETG